MRMRKNPSAESEEAHADIKLRPGTVISVDEIAVDGATADFRFVWARISVTGEQHIVEVNK